MPLEVCKWSRRFSTKICKEDYLQCQGHPFGEESFGKTNPEKGYCASQDSQFYGYKLRGVCTVSGVFTSIEITKANVHDINFLLQCQGHPFPKGILQRSPEDLWGRNPLVWVPFRWMRIKKTIDSKFGKVTVDKAHRFCHCLFGFQMSPYLQDLVAFTGQNHVYEDAGEQLEKSNGLDISAKQIERVTNAHGQIAESSCSKLQETLLSEGLLWRKKSTMNPQKLPSIV